MVYGVKPVVYIHKDKTKSCFRNFFITVTTSTTFDNFIMFCIVLNTLFLCMAWYDQSLELQNLLVNVNYVFIAIFTLEAIFKLTALRRNYFKDGWNLFDFTVVILTFIALILANFQSLGVNLSQQATMVRILRILRVLRLIKRAKHLKIISETIMASLPALASLGLLLLLMIFLFTVIGV